MQYFMRYLIKYLKKYLIEYLLRYFVKSKVVFPRPKLSPIPINRQAFTELLNHPVPAHEFTDIQDLFSIFTALDIDIFNSSPTQIIAE